MPAVATRRSEYPRTLAALNDLFDGLDRDLASFGVDEGTRFWVQLAAEEIFSNMVRHNRAGGNSIAVDLQIDPDSVSLDLTDFDVEPFDPDSVAKIDETLPAGPRTPGGLAVFIVRARTDELSYRHDGGNMVVSFTRHREPRS